MKKQDFCIRVAAYFLLAVVFFVLGFKEYWWWLASLGFRLAGIIFIIRRKKLLDKMRSEDNE